jgi:glycosyltransferase involved in cell wall biosynthesis
MNILLINHYAGGPPFGMEHRPYHLAREWVRLGHHVTIAAASHSHVRATQPTLTAGPKRPTEELLDGIHYRWYPTPAYSGNGLARLRNVRAFLRAVQIDAATLRSAPKPDVVIASSTYPLDVRVARGIARACDAVLVYEVHDLWPLSLIEVSKLPRWHPFVLWCGAAERAAYRDADVVVSMLPKVHAHMKARGLDLMKLHLIPNGVVPDDWAHAAATAPTLRGDVVAAIQRARSKGYTVVGYTGSMGKPNALETLLDAAEILRKERFAFLLVGDGHERTQLEQRAKASELSTVIFLDPVPKAHIPALLASFDVAYIGWRRAPIYRFGIAPNKLMDYMMAGCAVLHSVDAGNDPVREAECGLTVPPEDAKAVARGLRQLALLPRRERVAMGLRGQAFVKAHHSYPMLAERFVQAVLQAIARRKGQASVGVRADMAAPATSPGQSVDTASRTEPPLGPL